MTVTILPREKYKAIRWKMKDNTSGKSREENIEEERRENAKKRARGNNWRMEIKHQPREDSMEYSKLIFAVMWKIKVLHFQKYLITLIDFVS